MSSIYFGGIEGGATHSKLIILNEKGEILAHVSGPGTNHWITGIPECAKRITDMVNEAKTVAGIDSNLQLKALGLSLSGCEQDETNKQLEARLREFHSNVAKSYVVCSDTVGSIYTTSSLGGMVVISGTGSNCLLRNPDGKTYGCGGWGNVLGDEGGAWWIAHRATKIVFDDMDNFEKSPYPIDVTWAVIKEHFSVETRLDLLDHCYGKFNKPFFAGLTKRLSKIAYNGDELAKFIFKEAGRLLAKGIAALLPKVDPILVANGELSVTCVGSVWNSWDLLKDGFLNELKRSEFNYTIKLVKLTESMALGATFLAADSVEYNLPRDYTKNYETFYSYNKQLNGHIS